MTTMAAEKMNVLLVEDDHDLSEVISERLRASGYAVYSASSGGEALRIAGREIVDLILMDVGLPDMSGVDVCRIIKSEESHKNTPVIIISGKTGVVDKIACFLAGAKRYITKPFLMDELVEHISCFSGANTHDGALTRAL